MKIDVPAMNQSTNHIVRRGDDLNLEPLKVTALMYLREARINESYETMTELVHYARHFGANPEEVADALLVGH